MNVKTLNTTSLDGDVVIIKKGSASSGGSTPPSGGSTIEYLDVSEYWGIQNSLRDALATLADILKVKDNGETFVGTGTAGMQALLGSSITATDCIAVAIDLTRHMRGKDADGQLVFDFSIADFLITNIPDAQEQLDSIPRLTKEQFYTL